MKHTTLIIFIFLTINIFSQNKVTIILEDAYSFKRITNSYILTENNNKEVKLYKSDQYGTVTLNNLKNKISVTFFAEGYQTVKTHFNIKENLNIKAILLPQKKHLPKATNNILIKGKIKNLQTGESIKNALIKFNEFNIELKTDADGKFFLQKNAIKNFNTFNEGDSITAEIYSLDFQTFKSKFRLSLSQEIKCFFLKPFKTIQIKPSVSITDNFIIKKIYESLKFQNSNTKGCGSLPSSIRVGTNCSCNSCSSVSVMSLEIYVQKGLNDEWISSWGQESLKAGSLPYKTYGAYHVLHPVNTNYDISNTTCKQVWDNDYATSCINAATATEGEFLVTAENNIAFSEYSAENNGLNAPTGQGCGDGYAGTGNSYPCISDNVCAGHDRFGHGRGMCQWGSQRWSLEGKDYMWITDHYYNPVNISRCNSDIPVQTLNCSSAININLNTVFHGNSSNENSFVSSYGCNDWTETGPERVHKVTLSESGTITATISDFTGDLDVYILGSCNPSDCLGAVSSSASTYEDAPAGTYYIVVDADDGSGSEYNLIINQNTTADSTEIVNKFRIQPNPSKDIFHIVSDIETIKEIKVFNITKQEIVKTESSNINLINFPVGIYFIEITNIKNEKEIHKIIKN